MKGLGMFRAMLGGKKEAPKHPSKNEANSFSIKTPEFITHDVPFSFRGGSSSRYKGTLTLRKQKNRRRTQLKKQQRQRILHR